MNCLLLLEPSFESVPFTLIVQFSSFHFFLHFSLQIVPLYVFLPVVPPHFSFPLVSTNCSFHLFQHILSFSLFLSTFLVNHSCFFVIFPLISLHYSFSLQLHYVTSPASNVPIHAQAHYLSLLANHYCYRSRPLWLALQCSG